MCGLVGMYSTSQTGFTIEQVQALEQSMFLNQLRGDDSTGMAFIDINNVWGTLKNVGGWKAFVKQYQYDPFRKRILNDARLVMGHGRAATRGNVTLENAHPFILPRKDKKNSELILIHNGTLDYDQPLGNMYTHGSKVDSEWLGHMIVEHGAEKALSEIGGAIATIWWDGEDNTYNFYRNDQRPLCFMASASKGSFYLNSELTVLQYLNFRFKLGVEDKNLFLLKEQIWYKMDPENFDGGFVQTPIKKYVKPPYVAPPRKNVVGGYAGMGYEYGNMYNQPFPPEDKKFWDREIEVIEFFNRGTVEAPKWEKEIIYRNKSKATFQIDAPPEVGLARMYENKVTGDVTKVYHGDGPHGSLIYVQERYDSWKRVQKEKEEVKIEVKKIETAAAKPGNLVRFQTRDIQNKKIKHKATLVAPGKHPWIMTYENSEDGLVKVGDKVQVEVVHVQEEKEQDNKTMLKVFCSRAKPVTDRYIDMIFHTRGYTKQELLQETFFEGKIGSMKLAGADELAQTGSYCLCNLKDIKPMGNQGAVVNAPAPQLH